MDSSQTETSSAPRSTYLNSLAGTAEQGVRFGCAKTSAFTDQKRSDTMILSCYGSAAGVFTSAQPHMMFYCGTSIFIVFV
jgi:hypothetical protein